MTGYLLILFQRVAHTYVKEYVASYKTCSVNVKDFLDHGEEFAIGTDESKEQAAFVSQVLDIYENSYDFDK